VNQPSERGLATVAEDLAFLDREWSDRVSDGDIRRTSGVLGILLVHGWYGLAWRTAGKHGEPSVLAVDLPATFAGRDLRAIEYAQAGGATSYGVEVLAVREYARAPSAEEVRESYERALEAFSNPAQRPERLYRLTEYLDSPALIATGRAISRRDRPCPPRRQRPTRSLRAISLLRVRIPRLGRRARPSLVGRMGATGLEPATSN
jgi:hypothetical protein